ncbi:hypothetical protein KAFR_0G03440 [Kazachstania africana CBS 2517]|uniref:SWR1-complex protein 5 n=1 Tax=Kazachstania africana (strain ATCC 22294 / BCRC 22015 / CBS 2517 / CECT 1963 / NBRC 1671 / NRRL Y-8276) TaxID=1071382 RepID=H2AYC6_KAZAF|nr:hypothetical protein KAFR_0G03440 [Kazachstania africana CBS 2517]CCF59376.1 hypothetical protein KAFR_0G03440 [Kazachstania africana CBS 2517]
MSEDTQREVPETIFDEEEGYNESEDEDFDPHNLENGPQDEDEDNEVDDYKEQEKKYSGIESETGGLVKTRRARAAEDAFNEKNKYETLQEGHISDAIGNIWEEMNRQSEQRLSHNGAKGSILSDTPAETTTGDMQEEQILIERSYKFAGEMVHEKKWVSRASAEGKEYLNSLKFKYDPAQEAKKVVKPTDQTKGLNLRRPLKRPPILEQIIAGALKPKLTTLEKSKLDWVTYVDKEGITEELALHNKDGYLSKQDFLNRVETHKDKQYKELRRKQLEMQFQQQK